MQLSEDSPSFSNTQLHFEMKGFLLVIFLFPYTLASVCFCPFAYGKRDNGQHYIDGLLRLLTNGSWNLVSAIELRDNDAKVFCKMLGYTSGERGMEPDWDDITYPKNFFILDSPSCSGNEANIYLCPFMTENFRKMRLANSLRSILDHLTEIRCFVENKVEFSEPVKQDCVKEGTERTEQFSQGQSKRGVSTNNIVIVIVVFVLVLTILLLIPYLRWRK